MTTKASQIFYDDRSIAQTLLHAWERTYRSTARYDRRKLSPNEIHSRSKVCFHPNIDRMTRVGKIDPNIIIDRVLDPAPCIRNTPGHNDRSIEHNNDGRSLLFSEPSTDTPLSPHRVSRDRTGVGLLLERDSASLYKAHRIIRIRPITVDRTTKVTLAVDSIG
ncbi:hypothetical protein F2Q69_00028170 [Brassica cretica]|uniref:Uncharacterized protein n=1 Tax=Brassica cretica TaxID=69181 RepID=A0A8S9RRX9_BRACR|nr:hypothetical protein F2Q69_00028170 [Brassica cretica]